jgi:hypothetical protein
MRIKVITSSALAVLALSASLGASAASAETRETNSGTVSVHTVQTPTGPLQVPDVLSGTGTNADGKSYTWSISPCLYASDEQILQYTEAETLATESWCFRSPGTINASAKRKRSASGEKRQSQVATGGLATPSAPAHGGGRVS